MSIIPREDFNAGNYFKCNLCGMIFFEKHFLEIHIQQFHEQKCICNVCKNEFDGITKLMQHLKTHAKVEVRKSSTKEPFHKEKVGEV